MQLERHVEHDHAPANTASKDRATITNRAIVHEDELKKINNAVNTAEEKRGTRAENTVSPKKSPEPKKEEKLEESITEEEEEETEAAARHTLVQNQVANKRYSQRLPTKTLENGRRICETPECSMAGIALYFYFH